MSLSRNAPCPCGSGRKFKHCCAGKTPSAPATARPPSPLLATARQHHQAGRLDLAEAGYRQILAIDGGHPEALHLFGALLLQRGQAEAALPLIRQSVSSAPSAAKYLNLATALHRLRQLPAALEAARQAVTLAPGMADTHEVLAVILLDLGFPRPAAGEFQHALTLAPTLTSAHDGLLLSLQYLPEVSNEQLAAAHRAYGQRYRTPAPAHPAARCSGPLRRIGLVSGDFTTHPVGNILRGLLPALAAQGFEIVLYATRPLPPTDPVTRALTEAPVAWRQIDALSDSDAAALIRRDGIDLLLDLAGHTGHNRLPLFALRPAPLQATWLGYTASTGMPGIDYLIADAVSVPDGDHAFYSEKIVHLPGSRLVFVPPLTDAALAPPPLLVAGAPTFGCFNNIAKLTPEVAALWARLLQELPPSRLFLKGRQFDHAISRQAVLDLFGRAGVPPGQLLLEGFSRREDGYYPAFARVDVGLDPFPFTGGATTLDALWMGVPVVTLRGRSLVARQGESVLHALGHPEWIAETPDDYVRLARKLVTDPARLAATRQTLRGELLASPAGNARAYAAALGEVFRKMWAHTT